MKSPWWFYAVKCDGHRVRTSWTPIDYRTTTWTADPLDAADPLDTQAIIPGDKPQLELLS